MLLTSNLYSILYYNCEIWLMNSLQVGLKQHLLSASANALKILNNRTDLRISFEQLHKDHKRAPPMDMMKYRLAIQLFKLYNDSERTDDWIDLNLQQNFNPRHQTIQINDVSNLRVGKNILPIRLGVLNNFLTFDSMNLSLNSFKIHFKKLFLNNQ